MQPMVTLAFISSPQDWIVILLIVLLLFGAKKLPELARGIGKSMGEFKRAREDFESDVAKAAAEPPATKVVPAAKETTASKEPHAEG